MSGSARIQRIFGIVENKPVLTGLRPTMQAFFQFADDVNEVGKGALVGLENVHPFDGFPQLPFFLEIEPTTWIRSFDEHTEQRDENGLMVKSRES
jgi:hypothetical protein